MRANRTIAIALAVCFVGGGIALPILLATELDLRIGIPAAVLVGAVFVAFVVVLIAYGRRAKH